jgi:hypothetical protein
MGAQVACNSEKCRMKRRRVRWIVFGALGAVVLAGAAAYRFFQSHHWEPWQLLAAVEQLEHGGADPTSVQMLGWNLAILGRDDEVREMDFLPQGEMPSSTVAAEDLELIVVPWRSGVEDIAAKHRIVMIMEDHFISKHREFIGGALPAFKDAGFTHYAAEAIGRFDSSLAERGYPNKYTGLYTSDPQFGNVLRRALELDFSVLGYDYGRNSHEEREEFAATRLAELFQQDANAKLLVHAGHSHVLKHKAANGQRWLASLLWEKTGIEPFTIWQWSSKHDGHDYETIVKALKGRGVSFEEPVLLWPPPALDCGLRDSPYGLASVYAIVLHPPDDSVAPAKRTVLFPEGMKRVAGRWTAPTWPVVVSAYKRGEPADAIPLDQVMLRQGETDFVLWIPGGVEYEMRAFDRAGLLKSHVEADGDLMSIGR